LCCIPHSRFLGTSRVNELDAYVEEDLRSFSGAGVQFDLAAEVIHRGRDHGLPDYNTLRTAYGLQKVKYVVVALR
jgi:peroxidase